MAVIHALQVRIQAGRAVPEDAVDLAVLRVRSVLREAAEPVLSARVKLSMADDATGELVAGRSGAGRSAAGRPAVAQVNVDLDGRPVRVQAAAGSLRIAIMRACELLPAQLDRARLVSARKAEATEAALLAGARPGRRSAQAAIALPSPRPPRDESQVARHKAYGLARLTPDEAIAELEVLGYEFHLFTELSTDADSVVYVENDGYRLALAPTGHRSIAGAGLDAEWLGSAVTVSSAEVPLLALTEAEARLESESAERWFLFYVDKLTGRGHVLYRRYDGGYGLIVPADG